MSDQQQDMSSDGMGSDIGVIGPQQQVQVEGMETMRVRVTNIIEGFFKFANRSASNLSNSQQSLSESGRSTVSNNPNSNLFMASRNTTRTTSNSSSSTAPRRARSGGTKKVKFKDGVRNPTYSPLDDSYTRRDETMDASTGSQASWNVHLAPEGEGHTEIRLRDAMAPRSRPGGLSRDLLATRSNEDEDDGSNKSAVPKWFEKYMPNVIIQLRAFCGRVVLDDRFQILMVILILSNSVTMGVATFDFIDNDERLANIFELIDTIFLVIFTIELSLQFGYWGYQLFFDGWLLFDFVIVVSSWLFDGVQVFRSFRIFRAFRLVVRIPILKSLVYAVLHVLPRISSIMALFALITYIFAVMTTTLFKDYYRLEITSVDYFGRLDYSLFTLFQFVTLEDWGSVVREIGAVDYYAYFIFCSFLTISSFILYSLVVAVVCDSFLLVESQIRKEFKEKAKQKEEIRRSLKKRKGSRNVFDVDDDDDDDDDGHDTDDGIPTGRDSGGSAKSFAQGPPARPLGQKQQTPPSSPQRRGSADTSFKNSNPLKRTSPDDRADRSRSPSRSLSRSSSDASRASSPTRLGRMESPPRTPPRRASHASKGDEQEFGKGVDALDPLKCTETTTPTATTTTWTLASGELERKRRSKRKKKRPVKQRIKRVQMRLDKLTKTQTDILNALGDLCREVDELNNRNESR